MIPLDLLLHNAQIVDVFRLRLFTGWVDVPLSPKGIDEAREGGRAIAHLPIDEVHVSTLIRAQMTAMIALSEHDSGKTRLVFAQSLKSVKPHKCPANRIDVVRVQRSWDHYKIRCEQRVDGRRC